MTSHAPIPGATCLAYHPTHAWVPGVVEDFDNTTGTVTTSYQKKETLKKLKEDSIFVCDEDAMAEDVDDLLQLSVLHDGTLLGCLRQRYFRDVVYTNIGAIVVAINPFNFKIPWYTDDRMKDYLEEGDVIQNNLPHSWAVAHNTFFEMRTNNENQCILVSGESGAGKTEASKIVMKYLGAISARLAPTEELKKVGTTVGQKMMLSNPILEAFGNAKTVRNDNSSRFGKLMRIKFDPEGVLIGADITKYLLEKSRILSAAPDERVYHSFYLLLKGKDRIKYGLDTAKHYKTVSSGGCIDIAGVDDGDDYDAVCGAMSVCGVKEAQRDAIWRLLGGLLTIQQLEFEDKDGSPDHSTLQKGKEDVLQSGCDMWGIDAISFLREMTTTTLIIQKQKVVRDLSKHKAYDCRDSLCKAIYDHVFAWLVETINATINQDDCESWIALLDIFGFEDFKVNSFEQLCINLTNETLQGHYNNYIFIRDMEECRAEGIDTNEIEFPDNRPCIDMIAAKGGILSVLDEDCLLPKATDLSFLDKICDRFGKNPFFERPKLAKVPSFRVHHYAGSVTYEVENFLEKNRDTLKDALKLMLRASTDEFVAQLLPAPIEGQKFTVGGFFKTQLKDLMDLINSTNPHWIRCIKPHPAKKPRMFDGVQTLTQLRSSGVLGTVQIRKAGYPIRLKLDDFCRRYRVLCVLVRDVDTSKPHAVADGVLQLVGFTMKLAQVGRTRVFLKSEAYQQLENIKKQKLQLFGETAVAAAMTAMARARTALFVKYRHVIAIQAVLRNRGSQKLYRTRDFDVRKEDIIAHVRILLKLQKEEEIQRDAVFDEFKDDLVALKSIEREKMAELEALWWAQKPALDEQQRGELVRAEMARRTDLWRIFDESILLVAQEMQEDQLDAVAAQEEREEDERQAELQRQAEEAEKERIEAQRRLEEDRLEMDRKREEQRRLAVYYWNKHKEQRLEEKTRQERGQARKTRWMKECAASTEQSLRLMKEERLLQARERLQYPPPRFVSINAGHTSARVPDSRAGVTTPRARRADPSFDTASPTASEDFEGSTRRTTHNGIGGLNPMYVNPGEEKERLNGQRLHPDRNGSLSMVQRLRRLQGLREAAVLRTPDLNSEDLRNPMNPNSPDWVPPSADVIVLPDGSQLNVADCHLPSEDSGQRRRRRTLSTKRVGDASRSGPSGNVWNSF